MKKLPFHPKRVRVTMGPGRESGGVTCGHFVARMKPFFGGPLQWVRCYRVRLITRPAWESDAVITVPAAHVRPWAQLSDSPDEYQL